MSTPADRRRHLLQLARNCVAYVSELAGPSPDAVSELSRDYSDAMSELDREIAGAGEAERMLCDLAFTGEFAAWVDGMMPREAGAGCEYTAARDWARKYLARTR